MKRPVLSPKSEALAYLIWAYANPRGWDCTCKEIAEALDVPANRVASIVRHKRWGGKLRGTSTDFGGGHYRTGQMGGEWANAKHHALRMLGVA